MAATAEGNNRMCNSYDMPHIMQNIDKIIGWHLVVAAVASEEPKTNAQQ